ncbi:hypothetical protein JHK84_044873 [Glycine max]|nr:hypothetical protein JHK84_044873 [Glycine max]
MCWQFFSLVVSNISLLVLGLCPQKPSFKPMVTPMGDKKVIKLITIMCPTRVGQRQLPQHVVLLSSSSSFSYPFSLQTLGKFSNNAPSPSVTHQSIHKYTHKHFHSTFFYYFFVSV